MARAPRSKKKRSAKISVDFTGVESGGRSCPDGTYRFSVVEAEKTESSEGNDMFKVKLKGLSGKAKGVGVFDNLSLLPQALWKVKGFIESLGGEADGEVEIDPADWIGEEVTAVIINENYEGRDRPKVAEYKSGEAGEEESEDEEDEEEEEESEEEEEEETEEEDEEEEEEEEEEDEEEEEEDEEESEDEDEEEEEEEDEEEEAPKSKKKSPKKKAAKSKFRVGGKVKFADAKGKAVKGVIMSIDGEEVMIEDAKGQEWQVDQGELEAA